MFWLFESLAGRMFVVLVSGLLVSHFTAAMIFSDHRADVLTRADQSHIVQHVSTISSIVGEAPNEWRDRIVRSSDDHQFRVFLSSGKAQAEVLKKDSLVSSIGNVIGERIGTAPGDTITVGTRAPNEIALASTFRQSWKLLKERVERLLYGHDRDQVVFVSVPLTGDQRLNFSTVMPLAFVPGWERVIAVVGLLVLVTIVLSSWVINRMSAPFTAVSNAVSAFGRDINAPQLPETGPRETREVAQAFNEMQNNLRLLISNRTQMLGALSHDLRTPLTLLRLRAENVGEHELRRKMLGTLEEIENMVSSTLEFISSDNRQEDFQITDIGSLVQSICDDLSDTGQEIACKYTENARYKCRPLALKRAIRNLIENAVKYGRRADVEVVVHDEVIEIKIEDEGPGIPIDEMEKVFMPFYRLETSRNRETGGVGLGMSVAQGIVQSHGGVINLGNHPQGGLGVIIELPI